MTTELKTCENPWCNEPSTTHIKPRKMIELNVCTGCFDLFTEVDKLDPKGIWNCPFRLMDCEVGYCHEKGFQLTPCSEEDLDG